MAPLLQVTLHLGLGTRFGLVGVLAVLPFRAALAQEVPALVEGGLEFVHPRALLVGVRGALAELVLLLHERGDAAQDVLLVHVAPVPGAAAPKRPGQAPSGTQP